MTLSDDAKENLSIGFSIIISLFNICMFIAGIIIVNDTSDANHNCNDIWQLAVLNVVVFGIGMFSICNRDEKESKIYYYYALGTIILLCFSMARYWDISDECKAFYQDEYPNLWNYFETIIIYNIIVLSFLGLTIIWGIYTICFNSSENDSENDSENSSKSIEMNV